MDPPAALAIDILRLVWERQLRMSGAGKQPGGRRLLLYGAVLGLLMPAVPGCNRSTPPESTRNVPLLQEQQFEAEVTAAANPVVLDFSAKWCGPCKRLAPMLESLAEPLTNKVKFFRVDVEQSPRLSSQLGVDALPALLFLKRGKVVDRMVGLPTRQELQQRLESLAGTDTSASPQP